MQWEYIVFDFVDKAACQIEGKLNQWGKEGWELISALQPQEKILRVCLKRPITERSNPYGDR